MTTMGEWYLTGITLKTYDLEAGDGEPFQLLRFFVRKYCLLCHRVLLLLLVKQNSVEEEFQDWKVFCDEWFKNYFSPNHQIFEFSN